jgi:prefoldin subunit 5
MTDEKQSSKSVEELVEKFKGLVSQADAIRQQMKELTRQIEAHTGSTFS